MNLLIITTVYPNPGNPTEGLFHEQQALALSRARARATVVLCKPWLPKGLAERWRRYHDLASLPAYEENHGIPVVYARYLHLPKYRWPEITVSSCTHAIVHAVRRHLPGESFDVIQVHGSWPIGLAAPKVSEALDRPFVITMHIQDDALLLSKRRGRGLYKRMLEDASAVVVVGRPLERFVRPWMSDLSEKNLRRIPNGVDFPGIEEALQGFPENRKTGGRIVSVGNLWPVKGIDLNLRALANLNRLGIHWESYSVVGDGPEKTRLERLARTLGIGSKVIFKGRLPHHETLQEIGGADIFSLPSWQEAFGVAYLEAMACGKPVIGCRGQGAEDMVRDKREGLLVEPKDVESLTAAIGHLVENPRFARSMGKAAQARAADFSWDRNVSEYMDVYRKVSPEG